MEHKSNKIINMNKEKLEELKPFLTKEQVKRYQMVDEYVGFYGDVLKRGILSPHCAFKKIGTKYGLSVSGVRALMVRAGVYESAENPVIFPTDEQKAERKRYFIV